MAKAFRVLLVLAAVLSARTAQAQQWQLMDGKALDIGVGADGTAWVIGSAHDIYRRTNSGWTAIPGGADRIAVDPSGNAWVVNATHNIFRYDGSKFVQVNGGARDIGVGADGTVWVIGNDPSGNDFDIWRSTDKGSTWKQMPGGGVRISVDQSGNAWVINSGGAIYRFDGTKFVQMPGGAKDIGVGPDGAVWVIGSDNSTIYKWNGASWVKKSGGATQIAAGPNGVVWVVNAGGDIYKAQDGASVAATSAPAATTTAMRQIFPRGQSYEVKMLQAIRYGGYANQVYLGGQVPAVTSLPPLDQGFAQLALLAAEINYAGQPQITPDQVLGQIGSYNDQTPRRAVVGYLGILLAAKMSDPSRDPVTTALRQWATDVYRNQRITAAKAALDQYHLWQNDPCGYEGKPPGECQTMANLFTTRTPPQDMIALKSLGQVMSNHSAEVGSAIAVSAAAVTATAAAAALSATLGSVVIAGTVSNSGVVMGQVATSLFAAFGGEGLAASGDAGALGAGFAGVAAAPIAAAVMVVVVGTMEGIKVVEAARVEPMLKLKLGAAMTEPIVIQNALTDKDAGDFFFLAYETAAASGFAVPRNTVDGEVRFYNQAGYVARYKVTYNLNGAPKSFSTETLPVGHEQAFTIPAAATNVVASGEWSDGINWKSLFTRNLGGPTYIGFTSYGTVFSPQVKDEYPEVNNIIAKPNQLTVTQGGGYVARIAVNYTQGGKNVNLVDDSNISAGWNKVFTIPADATNVHLQAWTRTGLVWDPWHQIIDKTYPSPPNECIKVYGTTLDPKYNNECH